MNKYRVGQRIVTNKDFVSEPGFAGKPTHSGAGFKGTVTSELWVINGIYYVQFDDEGLGRQAVYEFEIEPEVNRFKQGDEVIVLIDTPPGFQGAFGVIQSGNDKDGYEACFTDILAADDPCAHRLHYAVDELDDHSILEEKLDPRLELAMRYYDEREVAKERGASYLEYKTWLENQVLELQKARAAELEVLKPFATVAKEVREDRYSVFDTLSVSVLYAWLEAAEKALKNAGVSLGNTDEDKALHKPSPDDLPF